MNTASPSRPLPASHAAAFDGPAPVCLLLEGTYPFVFGGVSAWVDGILRAMPERAFDVVFIGSRRCLRGDAKYVLPPNLRSLHEIYLHDAQGRGKPLSRERREVALRALHAARGFFLEEGGDAIALLDAVCDAATQVALREFWQLPATWSLLEALYEKHAPAYAFNEFYWNTWNFVSHLWALLGAADRVPHAPVYHAVCTGYAGMLGAVLKHRRDSRFLLSEHGIYVKERLEEMRTPAWINDPGQRVPGLGAPRSALADLWVQFFLFQGRVSYAAADQIVSLFDRNREVQVQFGADRRKIRIIPNGVTAGVTVGVTAGGEGGSGRRPTVGFLGRIVPIKDLKTLLRAAAILRERCPRAEVLIAGPTDEDPEYHEECVALLKSLKLEGIVRFVGKREAGAFLRTIDVLVLTSLSEGLPFAILEAFACAVPVVATDVGACRELVEGRQGGDGVPGRAGLITHVADPEQTGDALAVLLNDSRWRRECGQAGHRRVTRDYAQGDVVAEYAKLYG